MEFGAIKGENATAWIRSTKYKKRKRIYKRAENDITETKTMSNHSNEKSYKHAEYHTAKRVGTKCEAGRDGTENRYKTRVCGTHSMDFMHYQRYAGQVAAPRDCMVFVGRHDWW